MGKRSEYQDGQFCWVDLQTTDTSAAKGFYSELLGWGHEDLPTDMGPVYTMFKHEGMSTAGMGPQPPEMAAAGAPPVWSSYVSVSDCEAAVKKATELGATALMPTMKIMEQGWLAFLRDPTGAAFGLWQPNAHKGAEWVNSPGGFCWNELYTHDPKKAQAFYEALFGWSFSAMDAGGADYWTFENQGVPNGGMMKIDPSWGPVPPNWATYFSVEDIEQSLAKVDSLGGSIFMPAKEVPEVGTFAGAVDPQGGHFMLIQLRAAS